MERQTDIDVEKDRGGYCSCGEGLVSIVPVLTPLARNCESRSDQPEMRWVISLAGQSDQSECVVGDQSERVVGGPNLRPSTNGAGYAVKGYFCYLP